MKYTLYRSFGNLDNDVRKHELIAVEYGPDINAVTNDLVRDVTDDLAEMPEYVLLRIMDSGKYTRIPLSDSIEKAKLPIIWYASKHITIRLR